MIETEELPDHVRRNRAAWDKYASGYIDAGERAWQSEEPYWGVWSIPESQLHLLPNVKGLDAIELGCGTAYVSAWLAKRGAIVTSIDNSQEQLKTARELQAKHGLSFPLMLGDAENVPLPSESFDLAISEYGAAIWCDPYKWIPEASRLLRRGGRLIFIRNGTIQILCSGDNGGDVPVTPELKRDYFGMHRFEFTNSDEAVEFHIGYGDWIRLLRKSNFEIEDLKEIRPNENSTTRYLYVTLDWARRWPCEEAWICSKK